MDENGDDSIVEKATLTQNYYLYHNYYYIKRTLQLLVPLSLCSFLISYNLQLFAQALDRKYMFLICNGILVFLARNMKFSSFGGVTEKSAEDGMRQITQLPTVLDATAVQDDVAYLEYGSEKKEHEQEHERDSEEETEEIKTGSFVLEDVVEEDDDCDDEIKETATVGGVSPMEEVNDACVSTEELNKRFEEFIRKMKEEIRIEAQQPLIVVQDFMSKLQKT